MDIKTNTIAVVFAKTLLERADYKLPYESSEIQQNAEHIAELITAISEQLQARPNLRFDMALLKDTLQ